MDQQLQLYPLAAARLQMCALLGPTQYHLALPTALLSVPLANLGSHFPLLLMLCRALPAMEAIWATVLWGL